eukprot:scaffold121056_cov75-Phaeocystis_antarctica.AAC.2
MLARFGARLTLLGLFLRRLARRAPPWSLAQLAPALATAPGSSAAHRARCGGGGRGGCRVGPAGRSSLGLLLHLTTAGMRTGTGTGTGGGWVWTARLPAAPDAFRHRAAATASEVEFLTHHPRFRSRVVGVRACGMVLAALRMLATLRLLATLREALLRAVLHLPPPGRAPLARPPALRH